MGRGLRGLLVASVLAAVAGAGCGPDLTLEAVRRSAGGAELHRVSITKTGQRLTMSVDPTDVIEVIATATHDKDGVREVALHGSGRRTCSSGGVGSVQPLLVTQPPTTAGTPYPSSLTTRATMILKPCTPPDMLTWYVDFSATAVSGAGRNSKLGGLRIASP